MASIREHNQLMKVVFDGNKHLNHVMTDSEIKNMTVIESRYPLTRLPVCGHCERLGMWDKGGVGICKKCGTITKNPVTYASYLASGYDIDPTGQTARSILREEQQLRSIIIPEYGR